MSEQNGKPAGPDNRMTEDDRFYPDLLPDDNMQKRIKRVSGMKHHAPKISWGKDYKAWDTLKRLDFAERLANSMNHAADCLQIERNKVIEVARTQEKQIRMLNENATQQAETMQAQLIRDNLEKQKLNSIIVEIQIEFKAAKKELKYLKKSGNHNQPTD